MKLSIKGPKVKGLSTKNIGKQLSRAIKSGSKIAESGLKSSGKLAIGDFKGAGKSTMGGFSSASDLAGQYGGNVGAIFGQKKTGDTVGRVGGEIGANVATGGGYGLAKTAAQGLAGDGLRGLLKGDALKDAALGAAGSYAGIDPNMLKAGLAATTGDIKGSVLQGLGSFGGLDPKTMQYASTGLSALTGDKKGLASNLASQFGAGDKLSSSIGSFVGGKNIREIASDQAGAYAKDEANATLDAAGYDRNKVREIQDMQNAVKNPKKITKNTVDKFLRDASGKTIMGPNNAPIKNPDFKAEDYDKILARRAELGEDAATYVPGKPLGEEKWTMDRVLGNLKREGGKALDQVKSGASNIKGFAAENKGALGLGADVAAAYGGYRAGEKSRDEVEALQKQQLRDLQLTGKDFEEMNYDPNRYAIEQQFLRDRISGGGITAQEREMQSEGDIRASRMAAAQRLGGLETQARLGGAGLGTAALAGALTGSQGEQNIQQQTNLARETSASDRLERDIQRTGTLSTQQTAEEADLAQAQGQFGLSRAAQTGISRANLSDLEMARANALQNLYGRGAEFAKTGLSLMKSPEEQQRENVERAYQEQQRQLDTQKKQAEIDMMKSAAGQVATNKGTPPAGTKTPTVTPQRTPAVKAPQPNASAQTPTTNKLNQTYSGPMARPVNTAVNTVNKAKEEADKFKKDPWGTIGSWGRK
jgi:hypothetical protein